MQGGLFRPTWFYARCRGCWKAVAEETTGCGPALRARPGSLEGGGFQTSAGTVRNVSRVRLPYLWAMETT